MVLCHICPFVFRLLKDNPGIRNRHIFPIYFYLGRSVTLPLQLCREIDCLSRGFLSFCGRRNLVSRLVLPQKFTLSALIRSTSSAHSENAHGAF